MEKEPKDTITEKIYVIAGKVSVPKAHGSYTCPFGKEHSKRIQTL
jgi:hypothetical protein